MIKNLPAMQETLDRPLGWEDSLETEMATHSSILAWEIPWTEEPGGLQSMGQQQSWAHLSDLITVAKAISNTFLKEYEYMTYASINIDLRQRIINL